MAVMRLLHTADWHLNDRLGRIDRTADLRRAVERIAGLCESERIDTLVIAGDLFSELARPDALRETIHHLQSTFRRFLTGTGTILACTGNHDSETFCQTLRGAMSLAAGDVESPGDAISHGRFFLATKPTVLTLSGVSFALMPWPTASQFPDALPTPTIGRASALALAFVESLKALPVPENRPAVLIAHIQTSGVMVGGQAFRLDDRDNISVDAGRLADRFDYVALGHVHQPQAVGGVPHVRYSGSIERMDLGEQSDDKSVVVVEIGAKGLSSPPRIVPLPATKIYPVIVTDPETDLPRLKAEPRDTAEDLVHLTIRYEPQRQKLDQILRDLSAVFPRWYSRTWDECDASRPAVEPQPPTPTQSFIEVVRTYMTRQLAELPEHERAETAAAMESLLLAEAT